jgi:hypothetical protein
MKSCLKFLKVFDILRYSFLAKFGYFLGKNDASWEDPYKPQVSIGHGCTDSNSGIDWNCLKLELEFVHPYP